MTSATGSSSSRHCLSSGSIVTKSSGTCSICLARIPRTRQVLWVREQGVSSQSASALVLPVLGEPPRADGSKLEESITTPKRGTE